MVKNKPSKSQICFNTIPLLNLEKFKNIEPQII